MNLRDFIPPIVLGLRRSGRAEEFESFDQAAGACMKGYGDERLAEVVFEKTRRYRDRLMRKPMLVDLSSLRTLLAVQLGGSYSDLNVIDFGGACGAHYFLAKALVGDRTRLRWHVVETPAMAERGRKLEDGGLAFFSDLSVARSAFDRVDIVYSSGAIQYVPDPVPTLEQLTKCGAKTVFFARVALASAADVIVVQETRLKDNGPGPMPEEIADAAVSYPATFIRKQKFESVITERYDIEFIIDEGAVPSSARNPVHLLGYFARKKGLA